MADPLTAPLFRGATRPPMMFGVPTEVLLKVMSPVILLAIVLWPLIKFWALLLAVPVVVGTIIMRDLTKRDDQYLAMQFIQLKQSSQLINNRIQDIRVLPPRSIKKESINE